MASLIWRMVPDHAGHGFPIGWSRVLSTLLQEEGAVYCWGQTILAELYQDLHMCAYRTQRTMAPGLTLLMVWSWEHIGVTRPITRAETRRPSEPFVCRYQPSIQYTSTESVGFWRRCIDEIIMFDWTPYDGVERWGTALAAGGEDDSEDQMYLWYT